MSAGDQTTYRFVPTADRLDRMFRAYEDERRASGIGTTIYRISPQQRVDTIATILGLNAARGWRRIGGEGPKAVWLRHLRPVLAETRESAAALASIIEKTELPGAFEPWFGEAPIPEAVAPEPEPIPTAPQPPAWRIALSAIAERVRRALTPMRLFIAAIVALLAILTGIALQSSSSTTTTTGNSTAETPIVEPRQVGDIVRTPEFDSAKPASERATSAYLNAHNLAIEAFEERNEDITPRELAQVFAGESDVIDEPAIFLVAMLRQWPWPADLPIPLTPAGDFAIRQYAAVAASLESGLPIDEIEPLTDPSTLRQPELTEGFRGTTNATARASSAETWPTWLPYLAFLPLLPVLVWAVWTFPGALRAGLRNAGTGTTGTPTRLPLAPLAETAGRAPRSLVRQLSRRDAFPGRRLHAARSVLATLRRGGFLTLVMRPSLRTVDFVFLVARRHRHDHERDRVMRMIDALKRGGVPLFAYDYDPDPRVITPLELSDEDPRDHGRRQTRLDLRALHERHPDARLVLVTDGRELVDYFTQRPLPVIMEELRLWPSRMLLTPTPVADWGEREMNLSQALDTLIGRATAEGFHDLAIAFSQQARQIHRRALARGKDSAADEYDYVSRIHAWLTIAEALVQRDTVGPRPDAIRFDDPALVSDAVPPAAYQEACVAALKSWLSRSGFFWLAACAAYPQTRLNITLYLGLALTFTTRAGARPLYDERTLAQLSLLPWFRIGRMPEWLRRLLFESLSDDARARVRAAVDRMLKGEPAMASGRARRFDVTVWRPENRGLDLPPDAVMADMMLTKRSDLVPIIRGELFSEVFRDHLRGALGRRLAVVLMTLTWCLVGWWLWPASEEAPHATGAWLPLIGLIAATIGGGGIFLAVRWWLGHRGSRGTSTSRSEPVPNVTPAFAGAPSNAGSSEAA
jgi:hypothetical protein